MLSFQCGRLSAARLSDLFYHACWLGGGLILGLFLFVYVASQIPRTPIKYHYANKIRKEAPKLFCYIITSPSQFLHAFAIWNTWARHCDGVVFGSPRRMRYELPTHVFSYKMTAENNGTINWLWMKDALEEMAKRRKGFDWYLHAPDTAFVLVENLKKALRQMNSSQPIAFGALLSDTEYDILYPSLWPGYVLSKAALTRTTSRFSTSSACKHRNIAPDLALGRCITTAGVKIVDANNSTDLRMIPLALEDAVGKKYPPWLKNRMKEVPASCCSADFISSMNVPAMTQYEYYHFIYIISRNQTL